MSINTKKNLTKNRVKGFTLIELLIAASIIGTISIISVKLLFNTVLSAARQNSIQQSTSDVQNVIDTLSKTIKEAKRINTDIPSQISTEGVICKTFRLSANKIEMAEDLSSSCTAPVSGFLTLTDTNTQITAFNIVKNDTEFNVSIAGNNKDSFGTHEFSYTTKIVKRTD